jgi:hypothetical protein
MNIKTEDTPQFDWDGGPLSMFRTHFEPPFRPKTRLNVARIDRNGEPADKVDVKSAQAHLNWIRKFRKKRRREEVAEAAPPSPSATLPSAAPSPSRDSLSTLRDAARQRRVQHDRIR